MGTERLSELFAAQRADIQEQLALANALMDAGKHKEAGRVASGLMTRMAKDPGPVATFYAEQAAAKTAQTASRAAGQASAGLSKAALPRTGLPLVAMATVAAVGLTGAALYMKSRREKDTPTTSWTDRIASERQNGAGQSHVR